MEGLLAPADVDLAERHADVIDVVRAGADQRVKGDLVIAHALAGLARLVRVAACPRRCPDPHCGGSECRLGTFAIDRLAVQRCDVALGDGNACRLQGGANGTSGAERMLVEAHACR